MNLSLAAITNIRIEEKAREMGMIYPDEIKIQLDKEGSELND